MQTSFILFILGSSLQSLVELQMGAGSSALTKFSVTLDFSFEKLLISTSDINCDSPACKLTSDTSQFDQYQGKSYTYKPGVVSLKFCNKDENSCIFIEFPFRYADVNFSILGLGAKAEWVSALKPLNVISIRAHRKEVGLVQKAEDTHEKVYALKPSSNGNFFLIDGKLHYSYSSFQTEVSEKKPATICFHSSDPFYNYYFFGGGIEFNDGFKEHAFTAFNHGAYDAFEYVLRATDISGKALQVPFDNQIFPSYDHNPFKLDYTSDECNLIAGSFFFQRTSAEFLVENSQGQMKMSLAYEIQSYATDFHFFSFFVYMTLFASLLILAYFCIQSRKKNAE